MPPKGGNPMFTDQDLMHIVSYVRTFQIPLMKDEPDAQTPGDESGDVDESGELVAEEVAVTDEVETDPNTITPPPPPLDEGFYITFSGIPNASRGPAGFQIATLAALLGVAPRLETTGTETVHHSIDPERPANAHIFFGIYFMMTGLHGLHVLGGMGLIAWLIYRTVMGHFGRTYYTPVDLGGLYWHIVDLIWIFLFPMFYLIS
ncbi:MAG: cytochrome c oxidase subunit 3 [Planctomycetes bacterium]|nr:cytochrome c oxidase subunit 3 [Planctomycetota bacterium]